jgi:hypothetical protein
MASKFFFNQFVTIPVAPIITGIINRTLHVPHAKYIVVRICPVKMYGSSTGRAPIRVNRFEAAALPNTIRNRSHSTNPPTILTKSKQ